MNKLKKWLRSPAATLVGFAVAAGLLLFSTVGGVRAALVDPSNYYGAEVSLKDIGVSLTENGSAIAWRDFSERAGYSNGTFNEEEGVFQTGIFEPMSTLGKLDLGKMYDEKLAVMNSGQIDEYVRVTIYRYWLQKGSTTEKDPSVSPGLIHLQLENLGSDWILDTEATTPEMIVLYYARKLPAAENGVNTTSDFLSKIWIDGSIVKRLTEEKEGNYIRHRYEYNGRQFALRVVVDAVQDHHAADAIMSAWGVDAGAKGITIE